MCREQRCEKRKKKKKKKKKTDKKTKQGWLNKECQEYLGKMI